MDKKTLYALILMLALFLVFDQFVWKPQRVKQAQLNEEKAAAKAAAPQSQAPIPAKKDSLATVPAVVDSLLTPGTTRTTVQVKNSMMNVTFSNQGGVISQVEIPKFLNRDKKPVKLVNTGASLAGMKILTGKGETDLSQVLFNHRVATDSSMVVFYLGTAQNPVVEKRYTLDPQYGIKLDISIRDFGMIRGTMLDFGSGIADTEENLRSKQQDYQFLLFASNEQQKFTLPKLKKNPNGSFDSFGWAAVRSKYFAIAIRENEPVLTHSYEAFVSDTNKSPAFRIKSDLGVDKQAWQQSFLIYTGPTDYKIMKAYGKSMQLVADHGAAWLRWLNTIFAWFLNFLHSFISNYGVVIIIFSIVIKILLHPFTHKTMDASLKMQRIQPQVQALQTQYKNDPKTLQLELSKLYKENGASPFSGCLPLIIQMPIFFSLYNVLRYSMDMRNAHFFGWLSDLSEPDHLMILPILMAVFMIIQSLMMRPPKPAEGEMDEKQKAAAQSQKMMTWLMPIMMFFIFRSMPSGLVLYWTTFNILSVVQQYYLQKHFKQKESQ
ncbi:MAG TPA: membrane protein insertase YidC [Candidatus Cloacimonadota bacterium]|nr:membrane protein insertase YidC [Candidatus Cloacimonadota bacterium]